MGIFGLKIHHLATLVLSKQSPIRPIWSPRLRANKNWIQSYARELQRQRCKNLQLPVRFENEKYFSNLKKRSCLRNAGVVVVNTTRVRFVPRKEAVWCQVFFSTDKLQRSPTSASLIINQIESG
jgi:hypothetical protein